MARRARGEGSVFQRKDGLWVGALLMPNGKRRYTYGRTKTEVVGALRALVRAKEAGITPAKDSDTVADFLRAWLEGKKHTIKARTWERYRQYVDKALIPTIGRIGLTKLQPQHLQLMHRELLGRGLSSSTVHNAHVCLHTALQAALRWGLVQRNVAAIVPAPRMARTEMKVLNEEQCRRFLEAVRGDEFEALYVLAITTGMRQGELLALRWRDVDFQRGTLSVSGTLERTSEGVRITEPKTQRSRRPVVLPAVAIDALHTHRARQVERPLVALREEDRFVFQTTAGGPLDHSHLLRRSFYPLLESAGLPRIRFHDLRHTAATIMLSRGVHPKMASEMLGHSDPTTTLRIYSHVTEAMHQEAAAAIDDFFRQ